MAMMRMLSLAYRAILAEPRIKASSAEEYSGAASRSDYMGGGDTMNQYTLPLGMQPPQVLLCYFLCYHTEVKG